MGYSPWGHKESDATERARVHTHTHTHTQKVIRDFHLHNFRAKLPGIDSI